MSSMELLLWICSLFLHFVSCQCFTVSFFLVIAGNDIEEKNVTGEEPKDNRALVDNNTAQSLTGDDIDEMRRLDCFTISNLETI